MHPCVQGPGGPRGPHPGGGYGPPNGGPHGGPPHLDSFGPPGGGGGSGHPGGRGPHPGAHAGGHSGAPEAHLPADARPSLYVEAVPPGATNREISHIFRPFQGFQVCISGNVSVVGVVRCKSLCATAQLATRGMAWCIALPRTRVQPGTMLVAAWWTAQQQQPSVLVQGAAK